MELKELTKLFIDNKKIILLFGIIGLISGIALYIFFPMRYYATGTFYISRKIETTKTTYFNYEGYYSQQTGQNYTASFIALLKSTDLKASVLTQMNLPVYESTIRKLDREVFVKKVSPQVVELTIKGDGFDSTKDKWMTYADTALASAENLNKLTDPYITITKIDNASTPVVKEEFRSAPLNALVGLMNGALLAYTFIVFKKYYL